MSKQHIIKVQGSLPPDVMEPKTMNAFQKGLDKFRKGRFTQVSDEI